MSTTGGKAGVVFEASTGRTGSRSLERPPVWVSGLGAVSGYGWGEKLLREGLYSGESAVRQLPGGPPHFDRETFWCARVEDDGDPADGPSRFARAVRFSAREAVGNAVDRGWRPSGNVGLVHGVVLGDVEHWRAYHYRRGLATTRRGWLELMPSTVLMEVMREFDFHGPAMGVTAMCASGVAGLLTAKLWVNAGIADDVLVITTDLSATPENAKSFAALGPAIIDRPPFDACRPFQEGSYGFVGGEASIAMMVSGRPPGSYATVLGGAMAHDAFHPVSIPPDHLQVSRAIADALADAGVEGGQVAYLNAHGTGTAQCDAVEAEAVGELLPYLQGLYSMKPLVGHCQAASGLVELVATLYGFQTGVIPAPRRVARGHPLLLDGLTACVEGPVLKSSLGMGGHNAAMVVDAPFPEP